MTIEEKVDLHDALCTFQLSLEAGEKEAESLENKTWDIRKRMDILTVSKVFRQASIRC